MNCTDFACYPKSRSSLFFVSWAHWNVLLVKWYRSFDARQTAIHSDENEIDNFKVDTFCSVRNKMGDCRQFSNFFYSALLSEACSICFHSRNAVAVIERRIVSISRKLFMFSELIQVSSSSFTFCFSRLLRR